MVGVRVHSYELEALSAAKPCGRTSYNADELRLQQHVCIF
jgi:hypothetical protein